MFLESTCDMCSQVLGRKMHLPRQQVCLECIDYNLLSHRGECTRTCPEGYYPQGREQAHSTCRVREVLLKFRFGDTFQHKQRSNQLWTCCFCVYGCCGLISHPRLRSVSWQWAPRRCLRDLRSKLHCMPKQRSCSVAFVVGPESLL